MAIGTTAALIGGSLASAAVGARGASKAAKSQERAARNQTQLQERIYGEQVERFAPFYEGGLGANNALLSMFGLADAPEGFKGFQESPGYQYRKDEALGAVDAGMASSGLFDSGRRANALAETADNLASQEYSNWYSQLAGLAGGGLSAAGLQATASQNYANGASNALANMGNAQSAGAIGQANALQGGLNNLVSIGGYMNGQNGGNANMFSTPWASGGFWG